MAGDLYCTICDAKLNQNGEPGMGFCPIHGWTSIVFYEVSSEEIF